MKRLLKPLILAIAIAEYIRVDYERWGKVVKASGAKVE